MATQKREKLNQLGRLLPEGLLADSAWLAAHGYSSSLRSQYVAAGWLEQPARQVYRRGNGPLSWQQAVVSLQLLMGKSLVVGGRSALEMQGFAHYLRETTGEVYLHGTQKPPAWLDALSLPVRFAYRNSERLFRTERAGAGTRGPEYEMQPWGPWGWKLALSSPERAVLELLDELPGRESFHQVDKLFEGLTTLRPRRLDALLARCRSVKVKRLFFFFADRHSHAWQRRIDRSRVDLGRGKRMLVHGGKLDTAYEITVPGDLDEAV